MLPPLGGGEQLLPNKSRDSTLKFAVGLCIGGRAEDTLKSSDNGRQLYTVINSYDIAFGLSAEMIGNGE